MTDRTKNQTVSRLRTVQRNISQQDSRLAERNELMVALHQEHRMRQADIANIINDASVGGSGLSESGVGAAITRTLGHRAGRVTNHSPK